MLWIQLAMTYFLTNTALKNTMSPKQGTELL